MLRHDIEEMLAERLVKRIEGINAYILKKIGNNINKISKIIPSDVYKIQQILKYGGSFEEIVKELSRISGKNVQEIYKIFDEVAKVNKEFAKDLYNYRNIEFIPYSEEKMLKEQVQALAEITAAEYRNFSNTTAIGYMFKDESGNKIFRNLRKTYEEVIDKAILSVAQGKSDFNSEMRQILKDIGRSGLVVQYSSGRTKRLDSAVRMNILGGLRDLNNTLTQRFGEEYGADGVEISVHDNPAPDHEEIQGRQFSNEEFEKLQVEGIAKDINGKTYDIHNGLGFRPISEYNCYHKIFNIVIGVSKPLYSDKQLEKMKKENEQGFEYEGEHYTMYEGTQLQRKIETEIRKQKDTQILAKASGDNELVQDSQEQIEILKDKYSELCNVSGLSPKIERLYVHGYRKVKE